MNDETEPTSEEAGAENHRERPVDGDATDQSSGEPGPISQPTPPGPDYPADSQEALLGLPVRPVDSAIVVLLTIAADVCLYKAPGGTGAAALLVLGAVGLLAAAWTVRKNAHKALIAALLLVVIASSWNHWWLLSVVGWAAIVAYAIKLHRPDWGVAEMAWAMPDTALLSPARLFGHFSHATRPDTGPRPGMEEPKRHFPLRIIIAPALASVLFILIFIAANPVLEHLAREVSEHLAKHLEALGKIFTLSRMFTWACWLLVFAALIRPAVVSRTADLTAKWRETLTPRADDRPDRGDYTAAVATLIAVNVLFLAFNGLDSVYLYFKIGLPGNISYSDYSHRGCFWLTIALALSTVVIGTIFREYLNFHPRRKRLHVLSYVWAAQNGILAIGALRRLQMYIGYNGLTRMRIVGIYGVLLVAVGLALMVWKVRRTKSFAWLVRRDLLALWVALIVLALTPRDWVCWKYNVAQAMSGNPRPLTLLHGQPMSPESFPPLIPLLDYEGKAEGDEQGNQQLVREGIRGLLGRQFLQLRRTRWKNWSDWQGSHAWALRKLEAVRLRLDTTERHEYSPEEEALRQHTRQWW